MCIFCKIIEGEIPSYKVYEDDDVLAILDISQTTKGHTLVMPKKHYTNILEMPNDELASLMINVNNIANLIQKKMDAKGMNILTNINEVAGQTVMHTHIHLIPRYDNFDGIKIEFSENKFDLANILNTIKN